MKSTRYPAILSTVAFLAMAGLIISAAAPSAVWGQEEDDRPSSAARETQPSDDDDDQLPDPPSDADDRSEDDIPTPPGARSDQRDQERSEQQRRDQDQRRPDQRQQNQRSQDQRDQDQRFQGQRDQDQRDQDQRDQDQRDQDQRDQDQRLQGQRGQDQQFQGRPDQDQRRQDDRSYRPQAGQLDERDLGVEFQTQDDRLVVDQVNRGVLANAGLQEGDVILQVAGRSITDQRELTRWITTAQPGQRLPIVVWRDGARQTIYVQPGQVDSRRQQPGYAQSQFDQGGDAWLGVYLDDRYQNQAVAEYVVPGSAADQAGIRPGDVIRRAGDQRISSPNQLRELTSRMRPGQQLDLEVTRPRTMRLGAVLQERPDSLAQTGQDRGYNGRGAQQGQQLQYRDQQYQDQQFQGPQDQQFQGPQTQDPRGFDTRGNRIDGRNRDGILDGDGRGPLRERFDNR
jgi:C-terminal processing protease CtpA/Prc